MSSVLAPTTIEEKARELCECIVNDPGFAGAHGRIEAFLENEEAKEIFNVWQRKNQEIHAMGHEGRQPGPSDLAEFESLKAAVLQNPLASDFIEAEAHLNEIFGSVIKLVQKTLQKGRVPSEEEMAADECCGNSGCGCH